MASGIVLVDKPRGLSSHGAVSGVRKALDTKKVGHAGTLDPAATGLLVMGVGAGTRLLTYLVGLDKSYTATTSPGVRNDDGRCRGRERGGALHQSSDL
jgi:tRNA pseudouridine55 synthase